LDQYKTEAEKEAFMDRFEARIEEAIHRKETERRNIDRRVVSGGCVVLQLNKWR
jgi:hypothetical protein